MNSSNSDTLLKGRSKDSLQGLEQRESTGWDRNLLHVGVLGFSITNEVQWAETVS